MNTPYLKPITGPMPIAFLQGMRPTALPVKRAPAKMPTTEEVHAACGRFLLAEAEKTQELGDGRSMGFTMAGVAGKWPMVEKLWYETMPEGNQEGMR